MKIQRLARGKPSEEVEWQTLIFNEMHDPSVWHLQFVVTQRGGDPFRIG